VSTLWTPSGEHRVPRTGEDEQAGPPAPPVQGGRAGGGERRPGAPGADYQPTPEEIKEAQDELDAVRAQLLETPAEIVVANHAMGMWELAALHLSSNPPQLQQAQLAIDALASLVDGLKGRLGEPEKTLQDGLAQIRMAFVQIHRAQQSKGDASEGAGTAGGGATAR
jgi:hypothetical protein